MVGWRATGHTARWPSPTRAPSPVRAHTAAAGPTLRCPSRRCATQYLGIDLASITDLISVATLHHLSWSLLRSYQVSFLTVGGCHPYAAARTMGGGRAFYLWPAFRTTARPGRFTSSSGTRSATATATQRRSATAAWACTSSTTPACTSSTPAVTCPAQPAPQRAARCWPSWTRC